MVPSGTCQLLIEFPPKLTSPNFCMACNHTLDLPCSAAHNFDGNTILQSIIAFPASFKYLMAPVFNQALQTGHVGFVTDTYIQCISTSL